MSANLLGLVQAWYAANCDGEWEHTYGVKIDTLDNPGWTVRIDLTGTQLSEAPFETLDVVRVADQDWFICDVKEKVFEGVGGALNLNDILSAFLTWQTATEGQPFGRQPR